MRESVCQASTTHHAMWECHTENWGPVGLGQRRVRELLRQHCYRIREVGAHTAHVCSCVLGLGAAAAHFDKPGQWPLTGLKTQVACRNPSAEGNGGDGEA